jgi:CBS domain-containing membrane protein
VLREEDNLDKLREGMERHQFRHLPVVDGEKLVGILSDRDMLRASVSRLETGAGIPNTEKKLLTDTFVAEIMQREVRTVRPDTPLADAARILASVKISALPVVEEGNKLVGIVTDHDFLRLTVQLIEARERGEK